MAQLTEVCANIKNYFLRKTYSGTYAISPGTAPLPSLLDGQYFRIVGSALNDGVWQNVPEDLANLREEEFSGEIWAMGVPRDFEQLCEDIAAWRAVNEGLDSNNMSPFQSESFGGYSYSKGSSGSSGGGGAGATWQSMFRSRLNTYRRVSL
jgi:uncharacterized membrane protein YgcG